ncbi:MAG: hypothetical protein HYZ71_06145 [Deltaproteobacteria bacterium]|nr:hypothetical protein [Deltaproteobacteria bacterium]
MKRLPSFLSQKALFLFFCVSVATGAPTFSGRFVMAGTAAALGDTILTVQETYFFRAIRDLVDGNGVNVAPAGQEDLKKAVSRLLFEEMVMGEIRSLKAATVTRAQAQARWNGLKSNEKRWGLILKEFSRTEGEAVEAILRRMEVELYLSKKVETLTPIITDGEIERYYQQNQSRFQGETLESQRGNIRTLLQKLRVERSLEEWIRFLRDKYAVVNLLGGG